MSPCSLIHFPLFFISHFTIYISLSDLVYQPSEPARFQVLPLGLTLFLPLNYCTLCCLFNVFFFLPSYICSAIILFTFFLPFSPSPVTSITNPVSLFTFFNVFLASTYTNPPFSPTLFPNFSFPHCIFSIDSLNFSLSHISLLFVWYLSYIFFYHSLNCY